MKYFLTLLTSGFFLFASAQDKIKFSCTLDDGDLISGFTEIRTLQFSTPYGNLAFNIREVDEIIVGVKDQSLNAAQIDVFFDRLVIRRVLAIRPVQLLVNCLVSRW